MRVPAPVSLAPALFAAFLAAAACATAPSDSHTGEPASVEVSGDDCAVLAAIAKEHYKFGPENPPPPLKGLGEPGWRPQCDWSRYGLAFTDYNDVPASAEPRERLKWVKFEKPVYDGRGAVVNTEIMHGPLAGMGYECRVHSGFAGWTVGECRVSWVS